MRELILGMAMSLDGFVGGPEGQVDWIFDGDPEAITCKVENLWNTSLHIVGRRVFQSMAAFWPTSTLPFAAPMNQIPKAVFSKQGSEILKAAGMHKSPGESPAQVSGAQTGQRQPGAESWAQAYVAGGDIADEIARLKAEDGKPIRAHGGAAFARSLIAQNLVDEYALWVYPVILGQGLPIFAELPSPRTLKLVSSRAFPRGSMLQIYRPA